MSILFVCIYIHIYTKLYNFTVIFSLFTVNSEVTVSLITTPGSYLVFIS